MGELPSLDVLVELDPDTLDRSELRDAVMAFPPALARLQAAYASVLARFDSECVWLDDGMVNTKSWLVQYTATAGPVAGSQVSLARHLRDMPLMREAMAAGRSTETHARILARAKNPRTWSAFQRDEELLVAKACELTAEDFGFLIARWLLLNDPDGAEPRERASELSASRYFDGRVKLNGDLDFEDGTEFMAELQARIDEEWDVDQAADDGDPLKNRSYAQRAAAALIGMARRSSSLDDAIEHDDEDVDDVEDDDVEDEQRGDIDAELADSVEPRAVDTLDLPENRPLHPGPEPDRTRGTARERRKLKRRRRGFRRRELLVIINVDGTAELTDGTPVPEASLRRWACDTGLYRVALNASSIAIDVSRTTYTPNRAQRRALLARDRGCVIPGCRAPAHWTEAHHVVEFPDGPTSLDNLVLLCDRHHKQIHNGHIRLEPVAPQQWRAVRPDGTPLLVRPPPSLAA